MDLEIINKYTNRDTSQLYLSRLREFLHDLSCDYPYFEEWLEAAFSSVRTGERSIVVCENIGQIAGVAILKDTRSEKKICTIRVAKEYRRQGIGTMLMIKALEVLKDDFPLITVSDEHIEQFRHFLSRFGFVEKNRVKSVYRYGHEEYYFNKPYQHQTVLMSIKPKYASRIMSGEKTVEFRKKCFKDNISRVYVYSSFPEKKIVGYFEVDKIVIDDPINLWIQFGKKGCIDKNRFYDYFKNHREGCAICIKRYVKLRQKVDIFDVFDMNIKARAPQNYCYIDNVVIQRRLRLLE